MAQGMLDSLYARLMASYAFVVFVSLFLAGSGFLWLAQQQQQQREMERLADIVLPISFHVRHLELIGTTTPEIAAFMDDQAQQLNVRLLLVRMSDRLVMADTTDELEGYILPQAEENMPGQVGPLLVGRYAAPAGQIVTISLAYVPLGRLGDRFPGLAPRYAVMLAVPQANLAAAWLSLAPRLLIAGVLALIASFPVALWLSRSISRPLKRITRASEEMALGNYDQRIPVGREDEIGRLASAFNLMAKQVALSHRTLREFLADVSHELRTPLTSIRGFSQAMTDGTLRTPQDYAEAGQVIHEEADRMSRLVEDLLYLSRVESGQFAGEKHPLDLGGLAAACVQRAERRAAARGVRVVLEIGAAARVAGEVHRLEQVLDNLLDNALKHTPAGGEIAVRLAATDARGGVTLSVHNSGSLIRPEEQPHVFDRFFRGHNNAGREGTGLGLAIARHIVEAHGGGISVTSSPGEGTEFRIWLPALPGATSPAAARPDSLVAGGV